MSPQLKLRVKRCARLLSLASGIFGALRVCRVRDLLGFRVEGLGFRL